MDHERQRLAESHQSWQERDWKRWGPYLAERAWGTVREDYSDNGDSWNYVSHDAARSRAYRWSEDGLAGICDRRQRLCFALALWNGRDPILKERPFGLTGPEGNHGEDVKEYFYYVDNTPTHSYMKYTYKYPHAEFPYADLVETNRRRGRHDAEYELIDTGVFDDDRYWDIVVEYAKGGPDDVLIRITAANRGPEAATLDVIPTVWFRNSWAWGYPAVKGQLSVSPDDPDASQHPNGHPVCGISARHKELGVMRLTCEGAPELLFTDNETNFVRLDGVVRNPTQYVKDGFHEYIVRGNREAVNPAMTGTKAAARYHVTVDAGAEAVIRLRLSERRPAESFSAGFDHLFETRIAEADAFYAEIGSPELSDDARLVLRQAFAGMLWSKQFYKYDINRWLKGDPAFAPSPAARRKGRNADWSHLNASDIISMPDCWEYPWFAAWDLAFHCIPFAMIDSQFAKEQLLLLCREWYMHPNGQLPAYEYAFGDVNPPVQAWASLRVFQIERRIRGGDGDYEFLHKMFHKLLLNFTWWVNRKDTEGNNIFQGGFLGLDNIGIFDRSAPLPTGGFLEQSDGTSWMAMFCLFDQTPDFDK
ncbi:MAG: MGH1-like glycoside hydrolase domain-containing protein [Capsulimonadaceae bacterium]